MKAKIHPQYFEDLVITCSCGGSIIAGSTKKDIHTEICSACHPFYTGQQKLVDTAGRVDKFLARVKKAQKIKEKEVKVVDEEIEELLHPEEKKEETSEMPAPKKPILSRPQQTQMEIPAVTEPEKIEKKSAIKAAAPKAAKTVSKPVKKAAAKAPAKKAAKTSAKKH
jgi:large subunit ribosomal protein L31